MTIFNLMSLKSSTVTKITNLTDIFPFVSLDASTCMMSEWITWSPCSMSCGMGTRSRERYVKQFPDDGSVCTLPTEETENCVVNEDCCRFSVVA